jgi:hypothetical protein
VPVIIPDACSELERGELGKVMQYPLSVKPKLKTAFGDIPLVDADGMEMSPQALPETH